MNACRWRQWWTGRVRRYAVAAIEEATKESDHGVPAPSVPDELPDSGRTREPWEFFDGG